MTKQELKSLAVYAMVLILGKKPYSEAELYFHEIRHYFDASGQEIGMIAFEGTKHESIMIFDEPRRWHESFVRKYKVMAVGS